MEASFNWIAVAAALILGFFLRVLFDELKQPKLEIVSEPSKPFPIEPEIKVIGPGFDRSYVAYRIMVVNRQKRYLNCAATNCTAWLQLDKSSEPYQLSWVGVRSEVTINVGDVQQIDICARGDVTGLIVAPTERGYFEPWPRKIGNGRRRLRGTLRVTCSNGKRAEKAIEIVPTKNHRLRLKIN